MMFRLLTFFVGCALLGAAAHATITAAGGYGTPKSFLVVAIAVGVGVGAAAVGVAWANRQWVLAVGVFLMMLAGEAFGLISTAERVIKARDVAQAPARDAETRKDKATQRLRQAQEQLNAIGSSSPRLRAALEAKRRIDERVTTEAAKRGCARNCRALLEQQVNTAVAEIAEARSDIDGRRQAAEAEVRAARTALATMPTLGTASPLADRLGLEPWVVDLTSAGLASLAVNGLGALLIAFSSHRPHRALRQKPQPSAPTEDRRSHKASRRSLRKSEAEIIEPSPVLSAHDQVDRFAASSFRPSDKGSVRVVDALTAYIKWCERTGEERLSDEIFADTFATMIEDAKLRISDPEDPRIHGISMVPKLIEAVA